MFGVTDLATYVLGTIAIILLPGPNSLYVLSVAAQRGVKKGYQGACGIFLGDFILMVLSATGVAGVLKANPGLFFVLKYAGAAYLAWVGIQMLIGAYKRLRHPQGLAEVAASKVDSSDPFRKALVISLLNPKAILFFLSFFIQFVDPGYPHPVLTFAVLGAIVQTFSALYLTAVIFIGVRVADEFRRRQRLAASMSGGVGAMFIGFGAKLATASMN
ncbi:leucine efflux protein LeuE [Crenobacter cavernae]|uniref:Leucine efflux protein LeuE n=1 Tax=Crenobacter cavernae TaxID=2290923 RepID=A0ABY0FC34_9NEIS|nr:leucine efflux protein LeuE [Crenobacter cavernae]RXZ43549.1 leucine efflux protein LeuE [Crenobacter cavernae]